MSATLPLPRLFLKKIIVANGFGIGCTIGSLKREK